MAGLDSLWRAMVWYGQWRGVARWDLVWFDKMR